MEKKLYKSASDRKVSGVCGGIAQYFSLDATLVRLCWILFTFFGGSGLLVYIICAVIMPEDPGYIDYRNDRSDDNSN